MHEAKNYNQVKDFETPTPQDDTKNYNDISIQQDPLEFDDQYQKERKQGEHRNWGKCIVFFLDSAGEPRIVLGPHWPLFVCAWVLFFIISIIVLIFIVRHTESVLIQCSTVCVCLLQLTTYMLVALKNPGIANQEQKNLNANANVKRKSGEPWYCTLCKVAQYPSTVHCEDCQVCICELDHHCPWTGKCIGKGNILEFYLFLASTLIFMVFNIIVSMTEASHK